ncbi:hypothetical protein [Qipengyuania sp.]|uniref:hypothetical protein n=1 Tax=Qipengyuania sp. TaxID=2004515 RepID=UPI003BAACAEA
MNEMALTLGKAGILLFTLGLLIGFVLAKIRNARLGLSAHLTAVQTGAMLVALALFWEYLDISEAWSGLLVYAVIGSSYVLTMGIPLSGIFGASEALPIAGAGHTASKSRETLVTILVYSSSVVMALAYIAICWFAFF